MTEPKCDICGEVLTPDEIRKIAPHDQNICCNKHLAYRNHLEYRNIYKIDQLQQAGFSISDIRQAMNTIEAELQQIIHLLPTEKKEEITKELNILKAFISSQILDWI